MQVVNNIECRNKIQERMQYLRDNSSSIEFISTFRKTSNDNLMLIDSRMPEIVGYALYYHYFDNMMTCYHIIEKLISDDPLSFSNDLMYAYKLRKLLCACALGLKLGAKWDGVEEANGGYIIVKDDGDIVAYHIFNRNIFENFLLNDTKFERGSTKRHKYSEVYKKEGKYYIKLNLAVRFK